MARSPTFFSGPHSSLIRFIRFSPPSDSTPSLPLQCFSEFQLFGIPDEWVFSFFAYSLLTSSLRRGNFSSGFRSTPNPPRPSLQKLISILLQDVFRPVTFPLFCSFLHLRPFKRFPQPTQHTPPKPPQNYHLYPVFHVLPASTLFSAAYSFFRTFSAY